MTIKEKVFKFNFILLTIFIVVVLFINGVLILIFKEINIQQTSNKLPLNKNVNTVYLILKNSINKNNNWIELAKKLKENNFLIYVENEENIVFSNFSSKDILKVNDIRNTKINKNEVFLYHFKNSTIARVDYNSFKIIVIDYEETLHTKKHGLFDLDKYKIEIDQFLATFILFALAIIIIIFFINQLMTKRFIEYIMKPLNNLIEGVKRIEKEDYDTNIVYKGDFQFEKVCETFNSLQIHLKEEKEKNIKYEKSRREMIAGISHDLRTPLTSVKGYIKGVIDGVAKDEEKQKKYLDIAYKKAGDIEILLEKLFYFSKLETGNMPFHFEKKDIKVFVEKFINEIKNDLNFSNIKIEYKMSQEVAFVNIDPDQLRRVLENIIENSWKYSKNDNLKINFETYKKHNSIFLTIKDNGIGVDDDKLDKIFEQFYRVDEARSSKNSKGNGMGLHIAKYIIEFHKGKVWAENDNGLKIIIEFLEVN